MIGREKLYLYALSDYLLFRNKRNDKFCSGALFSDEKSRIQIFIACMRADVLDVRRLMDEVVDVIFEKQPESEMDVERGDVPYKMKLRPAKEILNTLAPPPEKYWLKPTQDFFIHTNAPSPNVLFKKDRFGYHSSCWQTVRSNI